MSLLILVAACAAPPLLSYIQLLFKMPNLHAALQKNVCFFKLLCRKKGKSLSKGVLRILWGPSSSSVQLVVEMTDTLEMSDCKYCVRHLIFYKRAGV